MPADLSRHFVIAVSTRALFDLAKENHIFEIDGVDAFNAYQLDNKNECLNPGTSFRLVQAILKLNQHLPSTRQVEVVIASRNSPAITHRVTHSIAQYELPISRHKFSGGTSVVPYLKTYSTDLFLSASGDDVELAVKQGIAAAKVYGPPRRHRECKEPVLRVAFDGDAVLFSDESERINKEEGIEAFREHEQKNSSRPMGRGPMAKVLWSLTQLQRLLKGTDASIRTSLVTARDAPSHERALNTLHAWGVTVDEAAFLGGVQKADLLHAFDPHIFFDDQALHCSAACTLVPTAQVPSTLTSLNDESPPCPKCGHEMILRLAEKGKYRGKPFFGCSKYPKCIATLPLP